MEINHVHSGNKGSFVAVDDDFQLGEIVYSMKSDNVIVIEHTEVEPVSKGRGIGKSLVFKVADYARVNDLKVDAQCPFAKSIFKKNEEIQDVLE